jgi:transcriptional regulator with XRE-family HTH domain
MYNLLYIKTVAKNHHVTIKELLTACEIGETGFYKSLRNESISLRTLNQIAEYLDVSISELIYDSHLMGNTLPPNAPKDNRTKIGFEQINNNTETTNKQLSNYEIMENKIIELYEELNEVRKELQASNIELYEMKIEQEKSLKDYPDVKVNASGAQAS